LHNGYMIIQTRYTFKKKEVH